jgi:hypothetical protein
MSDILVKIPGTDQHRLIPQQIIYPYPPFLLMDNGDYIEMPDILTLVKMVYDLRKRVEELEAIHE